MPTSGQLVGERPETVPTMIYNPNSRLWAVGAFLRYKNAIQEHEEPRHPRQSRNHAVYEVYVIRCEAIWQGLCLSYACVNVGAFVDARGTVIVRGLMGVAGAGSAQPFNDMPLPEIRRHSTGPMSFPSSSF